MTMSGDATQAVLLAPSITVATTYSITLGNSTLGALTKACQLLLLAGVDPAATLDNVPPVLEITTPAPTTAQALVSTLSGKAVVSIAALD